MGWRLLLQMFGPLAGGCVLYFQPLATIAGDDPEKVALAAKVLAVAAWMLIWWISEAVPLAVTALLPMLLFPLLGVMSSADTAAHYGDPIVYLFFGGFVLALGLEQHQLHLRIALGILSLTGVSPRRLVLGFMLSTALLSMWISNTATTVMMLPMAISVLELLGVSEGKESKDGFPVALLLGIAFAANVGGMATLIGTPPNIVFAGLMKTTLGVHVAFDQWMWVALPIASLLFVAIYLLLVYVLFPMGEGAITSAGELLAEERRKLGRWTFGQYTMLAVFLSTAGLWIFKDTLSAYVPGLKLSDTLIAVMAVVMIFVLPRHWRTWEPLLEWDATRRLPWGILLLFGGGLCLAAGLGKASIIDGIAAAVPSTWPIWLALLLLTAIALYLTEVMSNVALVGVLVPVLIGVASSLDVDPLTLAIPATLASSCAFMLPMATPPNAIVFASGRITVRQMVTAGFLLNFVALLLITSLSWLLIPYFFELGGSVQVPPMEPPLGVTPG